MTLSHWIEEQKKLCEGATPGQWFRKNGDVFVLLIPSLQAQLIAKTVLDSDMEFIAASRTSLPKALELIRILREALEKVSFQTKREEYPCGGTHSYYSSMAIDTYCKICGASEDSIGNTLYRDVPTDLAKAASEALRRADEIASLGKESKP